MPFFRRALAATWLVLPAAQTAITLAFSGIVTSSNTDGSFAFNRW